MANITLHMLQPLSTNTYVDKSDFAATSFPGLFLLLLLNQVILFARIVRDLLPE